MKVRQQLETNVDYGERIIKAGLHGAHSGWERFFNEKASSALLNESVRYEWKAAAIGACIGVLSIYPRNPHLSLRSALAYGLLGSVLGCSASALWKWRRLFKSVTSAALKGVGRVRDEHWLEANPIDHA